MQRQAPQQPGAEKDCGQLHRHRCWRPQPRPRQIAADGGQVHRQRCWRPQPQPRQTAATTDCRQGLRRTRWRRPPGEDAQTQASVQTQGDKRSQHERRGRQSSSSTLAGGRGQQDPQQERPSDTEAPHPVAKAEGPAKAASLPDAATPAVSGRWSGRRTLGERRRRSTLDSGLGKAAAAPWPAGAATAPGSGVGSSNNHSATTIRTRPPNGQAEPPAALGWTNAALGWTNAALGWTSAGAVPGRRQQR